MKLRKVKILVESLEKTNKRWLRALAGKARRSKEEVITVASWDVLGKILSPPRLQILTLIPVLKPKSILELARLMRKDFKNVHSDVRFLAEIGLIELREGGSGRTMTPVAKYDGIELSLAA